MTHVHVHVRATHNRPDDTFHRRIDAIHRQFQPTGEIIAGTGGDDAERLAAVLDRVRAKGDHAVTADHDEIIVIVDMLARVGEGIVKTVAGQVDHVEPVPLAGLDQQPAHTLTDRGTPSLVGRGIANQGDHAVIHALRHIFTITGKTAEPPEPYRRNQLTGQPAELNRLADRTG